MTKMVALKRSKSERDEMKEGMARRNGPNDNYAAGEPEMHLENHHMEKMGLTEPLPAGHKVMFHGEGEVSSSSSHDGPEGARHSMSIRFHKGAMEHDESDEKEERGQVRGELEKNMKASEEKSAVKDKSAAKGKKIPERG